MWCPGVPSARFGSAPPRGQRQLVLSAALHQRHLARGPRTAHPIPQHQRPPLRRLRRLAHPLPLRLRLPLAGRQPVQVRLRRLGLRGTGLRGAQRGGAIHGAFSVHLPHRGLHEQLVRAAPRLLAADQRPRNDVRWPRRQQSHEPGRR